MTIKPFEIQGAQLKLGGVQLEAGTTGVVIPGVTQATSYTVEEVEDTGDQTQPFTPNSEIAVYDSVQKNYSGSSDALPTFATYLATTDDEGYIDDIEVIDGGSYTSQEATTNAADDMWAWVPGNTYQYTYAQSDMTDPYGLYVSSDSGLYNILGDRTKWIDGTKFDNLLAQTPPMVFTVFLVGDATQYLFTLYPNAQGGFLQGTWLPTPPVPGTAAIESIAFGSVNPYIQIPFRPKMRAGEVENISGGGGSGNQLVQPDTGNTFALMEEGDVVFDGEGPGGVDRGLVWNYGVNQDGMNSMIRQDEDGLTVRAWTENGEGTYSAPVRIVTNENSNQKTWTFDGDGGLTFPDNTVQTTAATGGGSSLAPVLTKTSNTEALLTGTLHLGQSVGGSITEWDSDGDTYVWFNSATGDNAGRKYAVGNDDNNNAFVVCFGTDGALVWKYSFDQFDFNSFGFGMATANPFTVKHFNGEGEYIYVGYDVGPFCGVVSFNLDGSVSNQWFYDSGIDPTSGSLDHHALEIDTSGNPILAGRAYGEWTAFNNVTAQVGSVYGNGLIVVNRSDIGNPVDFAQWNTADWLVDIDGAGNWYQPSNGSLGSFKHVPLTTVTGNGGHHTVNVTTDYTAGAVAIDATGTPFLQIDTSLWTNTTERDVILAHSSGQNYVFICALGSLYQFTAGTGWINQSGTIWTMGGSFSQVAGDSLSALTNISQFNYGGTAEVTVYRYYNSDGIANYNGADVTVYGAGYVHGDQVKILGSLLGGRDGGYITTLNSVQPPSSNTWYFAYTDYPTLDVDAPAGTYIRQDWTNAVGEVVSVTNLDDGYWTVVVTVTIGTTATGGSISFFAGNDATGVYYVDWNNVQIQAGLPVQGTVSFYMDQSISDLPTYNFKLNSDNQAFIVNGSNYHHTLGGVGSQGFNSASYDATNNIVYAQGDFNLSTGNDFVLVAFDNSNGNILWQKNFDDENGSAYSHGIVADSNNNCVYTTWENDNSDMVVTKISDIGVHIWSVRQTNWSNWNEAPQTLVDSNGDVFLCGQMNQYEPTVDSWDYELIVIKLSGTDGALLWSNSLTRMTNRNSIYEYYDSDATPFTMVNDIIYFGGYMNDRNNNKEVGVAISIPADGSGIGSNGDWTYRAFPNEWSLNDNGALTFADYTSSVTLTTQDVPHPDTLNIALAPVSATISDNAPSYLSRAETIGGTSKLTFEDGGEFKQAGIVRHSVQHGGGNDIWLVPKMNGQFIYFGDNPNNWNSTIKIPANSNTELPIGYTVTAIMNQFSSQTVYVNNDSNSDVQILVNGNSDTGTWYWGFGGDGVPGVYTIMKIDTNVWMLAGPNIWVD